MLIYKINLKEKYFNALGEIIEPIILILCGIIDLIFLPFPYRVYIYQKFLHWRIKKDMKKRTIIYNNDNK